MFAFFWTQNSHARTPSGPNTTRNTVQKSDFPRSWLIGSAFRKPATTSATGAEQQNLLSTEGNAPAANAPIASNWGIKGFGIWEKNSLMYFNDVFFEAMANRPYTRKILPNGMKFMLLSHPFTPSEDASFRIQNSKRLPLQCIFEALRSLMKLLSTWSLEQGIKSLTLKTSRFHKGNNAKNRALCWAMEEGHVDI